MEVRPERRGDEPSIALVEAAAFGRASEAELVRRLRGTDAKLLSLVAESDAGIIGHAFFSRVDVETPDGTFDGAGLGPIAVHPSRQGWGIGTALVNEGITLLRASGHYMIVVVGDPGFYARFGFVPAKVLKLRWEHAPEDGDDPLMVLVLRPFPSTLASGVVRYHPLYAELAG